MIEINRFILISHFADSRLILNTTESKAKFLSVTYELGDRSSDVKTYLLHSAPLIGDGGANGRLEEA